jgi:agmatine deiminase
MSQPSAPAFRMPAEWEPHAATWLAWPYYRGDWPGKFEPIPWVFAEVIRNLAQHERVDLIVQDAAAERQARKVLRRAHALSPSVRFHHWHTNRIWLRDSGCIFVRHATPGFARPDSRGRLSPHKYVSRLAAINFRFSAWAKYSNWRDDDKLGANMTRVTRTTEVQPIFGRRRIVLEGGSIDVNGRGTLLTTEECLLSKIQQRNPGLARKDYEILFRDYLGASHTVWLGSGIVGDDTHGHVDDLARFVSPDTVLTMVEPNRNDANHAPLRENLKRLKAARDENGKPFNIIELPMPRPVVFEGRRLPASYANFYVANGVVLAPLFNDPNDRLALNTLAALFPTRQVVPIYSGDFIWGLGAMHCMTQQQPK